MARPSIVKLPDGEVILKNFSKEKTQELKTLLLGGQEVQEIEQQEPTGEFPLTALSLINTPEGWSCVKVKFSLDSKEGIVDNVKVLDKNKYIALDIFKVELAKEYF